MIYTVRAFRGFDSHEVKILNRDALPVEVRRAFLAAVDRGEFRLAPGFAQDAQDITFEAIEAIEASEPQESHIEGISGAYGKCSECGHVALMTTLPGRNICNDCA